MVCGALAPFNHLGMHSPLWTLMVGTDSRTAQVSGLRRNLQEAAGTVSVDLLTYLNQWVVIMDRE